MTTSNVSGVRNMRAYDLFGNIALAKFSEGTKASEKKKYALGLLAQNKSIKTVLEKSRKFKGRLRKQETKYIAGEKTKEVLYRENDCVFRFNIDKTYFSPRLSNERNEIAGFVRKKDKVLVMFAGAAPYSIVIARKSGAKVWSNELNREANKYGKLNAELNKVKDKIVFEDGDIKRVVKEIGEKFDVIVMPRPQLKDSFLSEAFLVSKKGTRIYYYDFCKDKEIPMVVDKVESEAEIAKKKIKITKVKMAGEIGPYRYRIRVDLKVL
jgi:tRNA (guanine37-N1)-methyltransferase